MNIRRKITRLYKRWYYGADLYDFAVLALAQQPDPAPARNDERTNR